jgi:hypothetical protein
MPEGRKRAHDGDALGGGNDLIDALAEATASTRTLKRRIVVLESEQELIQALFLKERDAANESRLALERANAALQACAMDLGCAVNMVVNTSVHERFYGLVSTIPPRKILSS